MDIGKSFSYIGQDSRWLTKVMIAALVYSIPGINLMALGYQIHIIRRIMRGEERPLPEWEDFGNFFLDGLRYIAIFLVYMAPILLVALLISVPIIGYVILNADTAVTGSGQLPNELLFFWVLTIACLTPYSLFIQCLSPALTIQLARKGTVRSGFEFREIWQLMRRQPVNYLIILAIRFGLGMAVGVVTMPALVLVLIPCLGTLLLMLVIGIAQTLVLLVDAHLQGQFIQADEQLTEELATLV